MEKATKDFAATYFNIPANSPMERVVGTVSKIAKCCYESGCIYAYVFYTMHTHNFKKSYGEEEILDLIEKGTGYKCWFCNGLRGKTSTVTFGYEAYQGVLSLMPEDVHESFYNMPFDFEDQDQVADHDKAVYEVWKFLQTL